MDAVLMDRLENILSSCEYNGGGINTLLENALLNAGSVVKSVQRGLSNVKINSGQTASVAAINRVNLKKSVLICNFNMYTSSNGGYCAVYLDSSTSIKVAADTGYPSIEIDWQVIEFY